MAPTVFICGSELPDSGRLHLNHRKLANSARRTGRRYDGCLLRPDGAKP